MRSWSDVSIKFLSFSLVHFKSSIDTRTKLGCVPPSDKRYLGLYLYTAVDNSQVKFRRVDIRWFSLGGSQTWNEGGWCAASRSLSGVHT